MWGGSELGLEPRQWGPTAEHTALGAGPRLPLPGRVPEDELAAPAGGPRAGIQSLGPPCIRGDTALFWERRPRRVATLGPRRHLSCVEAGGPPVCCFPDCPWVSSVTGGPVAAQDCQASPRRPSPAWMVSVGAEAPLLALPVFWA